ncbi:MAG: PRC-barrel domain-containing protein [Chitinophagales bacterium]
MKKSQEIIGLPVFSILDGREVGQVKDLVINPEEGAIEFLLVNSGNWYVGALVLPFRSVLGIGMHAVTTESETQLTSLNESSSACTLLQRGIKVKGTKVLTRKGTLVGVVSEYELDEVTGKVTSVEFKNPEDNFAGVYKAAQVLTFGRDVLVVEDQMDKGPDVPEVQIGAVNEEIAAKEKDAAKLFLERQKQFLLGKRVTRDVKDDDGSVLILEGTVIDESILAIAESKGKMVELAQNSR